MYLLVSFCIGRFFRRFRVRRFHSFINFDNLFFDFYTDTDYYKYTQTYGEPLSAAGISNFGNMVKNTENEDVKRDLLSSPKGQTYTQLTRLKNTFIESIPHFKPENGKSFTPTRITHEGVSFSKGLVKSYSTVHRRRCHISHYELLRAFHFVSARHSTFMSFEDALTQYRNIRPEVTPDFMTDLLITAMKMYSEMHYIELNFASGPTFNKSRLELAGASVLDF